MVKPTKVHAIIFAAFAVICAVLTIALIVLTAGGQQSQYFIYFAFFGILFLLSLALLIKVLRWKVVVDGSEITVHPPFSKAFTFYFSDISSAVRETKSLYDGEAERIVIQTKTNQKIIAESSHISYERFKHKIQSDVPQEYLTGF
ncbi:hypothetical protein CLOSTMETH_01270 [[Clostridium] methylpentosum DSM 5476]|uniref:Uncharacterized protein n=1 Tax=[Clostridium] methylpentosum DSM 5476 TaxID=537013 RepID=C0EBQ2_9FIRM|nr:hypothetical protein CLOSTMETH_01270 [[Clostridium] methylpentosum DSM 5476]